MTKEGMIPNSIPAKDQYLLSKGIDPIEHGIDEAMKHSLKGPGHGMKSHLPILGGSLYFVFDDPNYEKIHGHTNCKPGKYRFDGAKWVIV